MENLSPIQNIPQHEPQKSKTMRIAVSAIILIVLIAAVAYSYSRSSFVMARTTVPIGTTQDVPNMHGDTSSTSTQKYKDGTYTAVGNYNSPAGLEHITVTLRIQKDTVISSTVVSGELNKENNESPQTRVYQGLFIIGYKSHVVGKDISTIHLNAVSGSSLTPKGFNDALVKIEAQANV